MLLDSNNTQRWSCDSSISSYHIIAKRVNMRAANVFGFAEPQRLKGIGGPPQSC